jgi:uncharacterized RDD family membrane protein YckC
MENNRAFAIKSARNNARLTPEPRVAPGKKLRYAGLLPRALAAVIDAILISLIFYIPAVIIINISNLEAGTANLVDFAWGILVTWLYRALFESSRFMGTPGKMAFGLRVTDEHGRRVSLPKATVRYLFSFLPIVSMLNPCFCVSGLYSLLDVFTIVISEKKQAIHDLISGCVVIYAEEERLMDEWSKELNELEAEGPGTRAGEEDDIY